jgi:hypothetical protein
MATRWGLSILDWRSHVIDRRRYHPVGVYRAECGHLLMMVVQLHEQPYGRVCEACAAQQYVRPVKDDPDQVRADSDAPDGLHVPALSLAPVAVSPDAATRVTLLIVAALPTPELRAGAFLAVLSHRASSLQSTGTLCRLAGAGASDLSGAAPTDSVAS